MSFWAFLYSRWLLRQARYHIEAAHELWRRSEQHHRKAGECLDRLDAGITSGRIVVRAT